MDVDSITHALLVATLFMDIGIPEYIIFAILGAVILDADILFTLVSKNRPSLFMYIHGGAVHSIAGSAGLAAIAYGVFYLLVMSAGIIFGLPISFPFGAFALICTISGAWAHIALDILATPGVPLFWPGSYKKYTAGIFAGPSFVMTAISWTFLILLFLGIFPLSSLPGYGILFLAYLSASVIVRIIAAASVTGSSFPTFNPLRWMVISQAPGSWSVGFFSLPDRVIGEIKTYPEYTGVNADEVKKIEEIPEVQRVRYHSYFTVAERIGDTITIKDPLRDDGTLRYPPYYVKVMIGPDGKVDGK
jgi:inner membrane protein